MFFEKNLLYKMINRSKEFILQKNGLYIKCALSLCLLIVFCFHRYCFSVVLAEKDPSTNLKIFFTNNNFSERHSQDLTLNGEFCVNTTFKVKKLRLDIDNPTQEYYDLEHIRINNISYSGKELYPQVRHCSYLRPEAVGDSLRLHLTIPEEMEYQPSTPLPTLDYYITFRLPMTTVLFDFAGGIFGLQTVLFLLLIGLIWFSDPYLPLYRRLCCKAKKCLIEITPELLLLLMLASFLLLRPVLHRFPDPDFMLIMLRSDIDVAFVLLICAAVCYFFRNRIVALLLFILLMVLYIFCFADCFLLYQFNTRISVVESAHWVKNLKWTLPIVWRSFRTHFAFIEYLILGTTTILWLLPRFRSKKQNTRFLIFCAVLLTLGVIVRLLPSRKNLFEFEYKNVFAYGMSQKMYVPYTQDYLDKVEPFTLNYREEQGKALNRNTILLVVESLSSYQSKLFSGLEINNMPQFDQEIAKASSITRKHLASSYNTTCNTFALLTGFSPLHAPDVHFDFKNPKYYQNPLPVIFRKHGYETVFLKPAKQVDFMDVVLDYAKFDIIIGDDDPFYDTAPRYIFNSVSDDVLLDRVIEYVKTASPEKKFFVYTQTVSMHAPYFDHRTGLFSYEETVKTFDQLFPEFMRKLEETGFFKNDGVLIVTGDHRAMVTIGIEEQRKMGFYTSQYVPLAVFGNVPAALDDQNHYNHVDLNYSLQWLMLDKPVRHQYQRNLFLNENSGDFYCAFFQQRTTPSLVLFQTRDKHGKIRLDGDRTKIQADGLTDEEQKKINSFLVWSRTP